MSLCGEPNLGRSMFDKPFFVQPDSLESVLIYFTIPFITPKYKFGKNNINYRNYNG